MPKGLAIGNIVCSCPFFREINCDGSFHIPEDSITFFTDCCALNFFFYQRVSAFFIHGLSFQLRLVVAGPCLTHLWTFLTKTIFFIHITHFFVNFIGFALLKVSKIWWLVTVQTWSTLIWIAAILFLQNEYFFKMIISFAINQLQTIQNLHLWEKIFKIK